MYEWPILGRRRISNSITFGLPMTIQTSTSSSKARCKFFSPVDVRIDTASPACESNSGIASNISSKNPNRHVRPRSIRRVFPNSLSLFLSLSLNILSSREETERNALWIGSNPPLSKIFSLSKAKERVRRILSGESEGRMRMESVKERKEIRFSYLIKKSWT